MFLAATLLHFVSLSLAFPQSDEDFLKTASELRQQSSWKELMDVATAEIERSEDDTLALAFLAIGQAQLKEYTATVASLRKLDDSGVSVDASLPGLGSPMVEVVNAIYGHCWANFDPTFNRSCWQPLFDEFPDSSYAPVAASRLLMAALKLEDEAQQQVYEDFFSVGIEKAQAAKNVSAEADLTKRYVDGYLRAGMSNQRVMELAAMVWDVAWNDAKKQFHFDGPITGGELTEDQRLARRQCELETDHAFNTLALATALADSALEAGHPLFDMEAEPTVVFSDITAAVGLSDLKQTRVAAADFDNDGDPDLCFGGRLFENQKGVFIEVGKERGIQHRGAGAVFGDYDGDGALDLLIASSPHSFLYRNLGKRGKYHFEDVSVSSGLSAVKLFATPEGAAWTDFDDDGDLDIYLAAYEANGSGQQDVLFENLGTGKFQDATAASQIAKQGPFCGRGISPADVDGDGDSEIFISNYRLNENQFWQWNGKALTDISDSLGVKGVREPEDQNYFGHTIGSCWGDIDQDGDLDLFSANLAHPRFVRQGFSNLSLLGVQQSDGTFIDQSLSAGIRFQETHSDPAFVDIDNDGDLDLSITCIYEGVPSALYLNDGQGNFSPITFRAGAAMFHGWGQTWLDIDQDGFLDVVFASSNGVKVLRNSGNDNHYLRVSLSGKGRDRSAFGAIVTVETMEADTPITWVRQLFNVRGTTSQDEPMLHFGLGSYSGRVKVSVRWPDSDVVESKTPTPDRIYNVKQSRKAK